MVSTLAHCLQFNHETGAAGARLKSQFTAIASHNGAGDIKSESAAVGAGLEGLKQELGGGDAGAGVFEGYEDAPVVFRNVAFGY